MYFRCYRKSYDDNDFFKRTINYLLVQLINQFPGRRWWRE